MKEEMTWTGGIMTIIGRLLNNREVRSLAETKRKVRSKIQAANKLATRYARDTTWAKRKLLVSGYSMYFDEEGTYCSELMVVMKAVIPTVWDPAVFWHVFLVSMTKIVYNSMRYEATRGVKRTTKGESKKITVVCFMN